MHMLRITQRNRRGYKTNFFDTFINDLINTSSASVSACNRFGSALFFDGKDTALYHTEKYRKQGIFSTGEFQSNYKYV